MSTEYKLCYIDPQTFTAYFTALPLGEQWGQNWDQPDWHLKENRVGLPDVTVIPQLALRFDRFNLQLPGNPYSVLDINSGAIAWLTDYDNRVYIPAGCSPEKFRNQVQFCGGRVYDEIQISA